MLNNIYKSETNDESKSRIFGDEGEVLCQIKFYYYPTI